MSRPMDWTPLESRDPIRGDADTVRRGAQDYRRRADAIRTAAAKLREIAVGVDMDSDAVDEVRLGAEKVAQEISRALPRYEATAAALSGYVLVLEATQARSIRALRDAQEAQLAQAAAGRAVAQALVDATAPGADLGASHRAASNQQTADDAMARAVRMLAAAVEDHDHAAAQARRLIDDAKDHDGLRDSRWDNIKGRTVEILTTLSKAADFVAISAGVLALLTSAIPFVGEFFAAVALYAAAASLALKLVLKCFGEGTWAEIGLAALGVATFGVGKVAMGGFKVTALGAKGASRLAAGRLAARSPAVRAAGMPTHGNSARVINELMGEGNAMSKSAARAATRRSGHQGVVPSMAEAARIVREIPGSLADDIKNVRRIDVVHPMQQFSNQAHLHPLTLLGERGAGAEARALGRIDPGIRADPEVAAQVAGSKIQTGAYVATWATGQTLLGNDLHKLFTPESSPAEALRLGGAAPRGGRS